MGNSEEVKTAKPEKSPPPATDQNNVHVCPDWAAMQAYYGPRVAVPPYFNSAVPSGHAPPPYMWGPPQSMMPPYGAPYAAFYAHGGVYAHPGVPLAGTSLSTETPKSSGNTDGGLVKKLKEFDGLAMSIGNGSAESGGGAADRRLSQSEETEGSSDGSNGNTTGSGQNGKKRSREGTPNYEGDAKAQKIPAVDEKMMGTALALKNPSSTKVKPCSTSAAQPLLSMPNEAWLQNERDLKRERRKQSNRESARRSRLRKQAETEELAMKVQTLSTENVTLKSEINKLMENSEKLKLENAALMDKLKTTQLGQSDELSLHKIDDFRLKPDGTANLLEKVNNSGSIDRKSEESEAYENKNSGSKLHQLLDTNPRTDAVAAG